MKINWLSHEFNIHTPDVTWKDIPGIYLICGINSANQWVPLYIGQASSLSDRIPSHERWDEAIRHGATHIHARVVHLQSDRDTIERLLIQTFKPKLNVLLK